MKLLVLFIHHKNDEATQSNYQSFIRNGNSVVALKDANTEGIEGAISVPIENMPIPRGDRYWSSDTIALNYVLNNTIDATHVLLCEWDVRCDVNLELLLKPYENNDVTAAELMTVEKDGWWQHFKTLEAELPLLGLLPGTIILFKSAALFSVAEYIKDNWSVLGKTNNECRLGTVSKKLELVTGRYSPSLRRNIKWHDTKFLGRNMIYHPSKNVDVEILESDFTENIYCLHGGGMGDNVAVLSKILYDEKDNSCQYIYFDDSDEYRQERLKKILNVFSTDKELKFVNGDFQKDIGRIFHGYVQDHQFPYYPAKTPWKYREDAQYDICYQFETAKESVWYNPVKVMSEELQTSILTWWTEKKFRVKKMGLPNSLEEDIATIQNSKMFVGIDSGFAHLCHVLEAPIFIKEFDKNIKKHLDWHYLDLFHANKILAGFYDIDELQRKTNCFFGMKPWQIQKWKQSSIFKNTWSDRIPYYE
jgi:hypothetical protein